MKFTIFRELNTALLNTTDEVRLKLLKQINSYIKSGDWEARENGSKPVLDTLGMKTSDACKKLNIKETTYKVMMKRASDRIRGIIGEDTINEIRNCKLEDIPNVALNLKLAIKGIPIEEYFVGGLSDMVLELYERSYNIADLSEEINVLRKFTKKNMGQELANVNDDKLSYIMYVLQSQKQEDKQIRAELFKQIVVK